MTNQTVSIANCNETRIDTLARGVSSLVLASRFITRNNRRLGALAESLSARHRESFQSNPGSLRRAVTELDPRKISPRLIRQAVQARQEPLVVPGFAANSPAVRRWTPAFFREHYGDTILKAGGYAAEATALAEVVDLIETGDKTRQKYLQAVADIFVQHPQLLQDLPLQEIFSLQRKGYHGSEFFLGGPGTASPWHAENEWTFFLMIDGVKTWRFIRPEFTLHMNPMFQADLIYIASKSHFFSDPSDVTTYEVTLQPGDLLVIPAWWWHRVENVTASTIAANLRFRTLREQLASPDPMLSLLQLCRAHQWRNLIGEYVTGKPKDDERYLERSRNLIA